MKVLVLYCDEFGYSPAIKNLEDAIDVSEGVIHTDCILAFIHIEESDEAYDIKSRDKKLTNHIKWTCRKNSTKRVILHSFAHLSESKANVEFSKEVFDCAQKRLENADYEVHQTPWGYFLDLSIKAPGISLARIWASL